MRYPILTSSDASLYLLNKRSGHHIDTEKLVKSRGTGPDLPQALVSSLIDATAKVKGDYPEGVKNANLANVFEARIARILHSTLQVDEGVLGDADFWTWLAVIHFSDVIEWRYQDPKEGTSLNNYGVGARTENFLYRLWLRAELVMDVTAADRYHLCDRGQIDFYRSHLFRQSYANVRNFSRALIRFQYPDPSDGNKPFLKLLDIRELVKRLKRLRYNLFVEILNETECLSIIKEEASQLKAASS